MLQSFRYESMQASDESPNLLRTFPPSHLHIWRATDHDIMLKRLKALQPHELVKIADGNWFYYESGILNATYLDPGHLAQSDER